MNDFAAGWLSLENGKPQKFFPLPSFRSSFQHQQLLPVSFDQKSKIEIPISLAPPRNPNHLIPIRLQKQKDGKILGGPFIAILSSDSRVPFSGNHYNFRDIIQMGRKMGVTVYVTTPKLLAQAGSTVKGYLLDRRTKKIKWIPTILPKPNVIYNRIPNRKTEKHPNVQAVIKRIQQSSTPIFNPHFFDKWTLYKHLSTDDICKKYLPTTMKIDQESVLNTILASHPSVMLKPIEGKAGIGMMRITKTAHGYECIIQTVNEKKRWELSTSKEVWQLIYPYLQRRAYLAQQHISLAQYGNRPFDVRMLFQKNISGKWGVTGVGIRVAGEKAITTHVPMGGRIESCSTVLTSVFGEEEAKKLRDRLEKMGVMIAKTIEKKQGYQLGEMSMDIGLDKNGRPWFFEANAKPMKFDEPEIRELSLQRLIQYSLYLSGYSLRAQEASS